MPLERNAPAANDQTRIKCTFCLRSWYSTKAHQDRAMNATSAVSTTIKWDVCKKPTMVAKAAAEAKAIRIPPKTNPIRALAISASSP